MTPDRIAEGALGALLVALLVWGAAVHSARIDRAALDLANPENAPAPERAAEWSPR